MGMVWEAYHKGVPLLGVPENPIDKWVTGAISISGVIILRAYLCWKKKHVVLDFTIP